MAFQTALLASDAYASLRNYVPTWKTLAQNALTTLQTQTVNSNYVKGILGQLVSVISISNTMKAVSGLDAYATSLGYPGSMVTDVTAVAASATSCISWVTTNFPTSGGFMLAETLNADGTLTPRNFTTAQTAGFQTALSAMIATMN